MIDAYETTTYSYRSLLIIVSVRPNLSCMAQASDQLNLALIENQVSCLLRRRVYVCVYSVKDLLMNVGDQFSKDEVSSLSIYARYTRWFIKTTVSYVQQLD